MKNEQSVFPSQYDPLIFFADADLDNFTTYQQYYTLYNADQYTQASNLLNNSDVDFYGAWLLNLIENELYAIESNMDSFVIPEDKPRLISHGLDDPTEEFSHWVYYNKYPNIPEAPPPPPEPAPPVIESAKWFDSADICPVDVSGWQPTWQAIDSGLYTVFDYTTGTNIGINAPRVYTRSGTIREIPLYDSNDTLTTYTLRNVVSEELTDDFSGNIGWALYNNGNFVEEWSRNISWDYGLDSIEYYSCFGADTIVTSLGDTNNTIWTYIILKAVLSGQDLVIFIGYAIDMSKLSSYGLYLGSDWFTPAPPVPVPTTVESAKWFNSPGVYPIDADGFKPRFLTARGIDDLVAFEENLSTNIGINAPRIYTRSDAIRSIPLYDSNGNLTTYNLRNVISKDFPTDSTTRFNTNFGFALYNGTTLVESWTYPLDAYYGYDSFEWYSCFGVDTVYGYDEDIGSYANIGNKLWTFLIMVVTVTSQSVSGTIYMGYAIDLQKLADYGLYLGSDWFTPAN